MEDQTKEIDQLINDFRYLKNAVMKTNRVFKFISSKTLRPIYLSTGLLIITFAAFIHLLILYYGSYGNIPGAMKTIYYSGLTILLIWLYYTKLKLVIRGIRELGSEITIGQMFREIYTWSTMVLMVPFVLTIGLAVISLVSHGLSGYLIPCLAILYGLMINSITGFVYLREFVVGGVWFLISGFVILFTLGPSQPLLGLIITFGLGFLIMYIASWIYATGDQR
jgi:hypothetical protein